VSSDTTILALMGVPQYYHTYSKYVNSNVLSREGQTIFKLFPEWHEGKTDATDWDEYDAWFFSVKKVTYDADKIKIYQNIFSKIQEVDITEGVAKDILHKFIDREHLTKLAIESTKGAEEGGVELDDVQCLLAEWEEKVGYVDTDEACIIRDDLLSILEEESLMHRYNFNLEPLNKAMGGLSRGDFIMFGSRPDSGKTTMLCNEAHHMAKQFDEDEYILWINNEEEGKKVKKRFIQSTIGWTTDEIEMNPTKAWEIYLKEFKDRDPLILVDKTSISVQEIDRLLKKNKTAVLIVDQLRKVKGYESTAMNSVDRLAMVWSKAREWAKEYCPLMVVHQADGTAEGQRFIEMNQLAGSKTDIQGEMDAIIMIGRTHDPAVDNNTRYIYLPKNKMRGKDPSLRNGKFEVKILPEIGRYKY